MPFATEGDIGWFNITYQAPRLLELARRITLITLINKERDKIEPKNKSRQEEDINVN